MERGWLCYGAYHSNCEDDLSRIIREFSKIIFLFFGFYKTHDSNLLVAAFVVKCNMGALKKKPFRSFGFVPK